MDFTWAEVLEEAKARGVTDLDAVRERYLAFLEQDPSYQALDETKRSMVQQQIIGEDAWAIKSFESLKANPAFLDAPSSSRQAKFDEVARISRSYQALPMELKQQLRQGVVWAPGAAEHDHLDEFEVVAPIVPESVRSALPTAMDLYLQQAEMMPGLRWTPGVESVTVQAAQPLQPRSDEDRSLLGEFGSGIERGATELGASLLEAGGTAADLLGAEGVAQGIYDDVSAYEAGRGDVLTPARVGSIQDIRSVADAADWLASGAGEQTPILAALIAAGITGGAAAPALLGPAAVGTPAAATATTLGQLGAGFLGGTALETGGISPDIREQGGAPDAGRALAGGAAAGLLEALPIFKFLRGTGANNLAPEAGQAILRRVASQLGAEASTEMAQTLIEQATSDWAAQNQGRLEDIRLATPEGRASTAWEMLNAGVLGGLMGGGMGVFGKGPEKAPETAPDAEGTETPGVTPEAAAEAAALQQDPAYQRLLEILASGALGEVAVEEDAGPEPVSLEEPAELPPALPGSLDEALGSLDADLTREIDQQDLVALVTQRRAEEAGVAPQGAVPPAEIDLTEEPQAVPPQPAQDAAEQFGEVFTEEGQSVQPPTEGRPEDVEAMESPEIAASPAARTIDRVYGMMTRGEEITDADVLAVANAVKELPLEQGGRGAFSVGKTATVPIPWETISTRAVKPSGELESEPGYVYHATNQEGAADIAESGSVKTFGPSHGTDQSEWPDGSRKSRSYWSEKAGVVAAFAPENGRPVILRTKRATVHQVERGTGDVYSEKRIAADQVEILTSDGWVPLRAPDKTAVAFSVAPSRPPIRTQAETLAEARRAFPAGKVRQLPTGGIEVTHRGIKPVTVAPVKDILSNTELLAKWLPEKSKADPTIKTVEDLARKLSEGQYVIYGEYTPGTDRDLINVLEAAPGGTLTHEAGHFVWENSLDDRQRKILLKEHGSEEAAMEQFVALKDSAKPPTWVRQMLDWARRMLQTIGLVKPSSRAYTAKEIMADMISGRTAEYGPAAGGGTAAASLSGDFDMASLPRDVRERQARAYAVAQYHAWRKTLQAEPTARDVENKRWALEREAQKRFSLDAASTPRNASERETISKVVAEMERAMGKRLSARNLGEGIGIGVVLDDTQAGDRVRLKMLSGPAKGSVVSKPRSVIAASEEYIIDRPGQRGSSVRLVTIGEGVKAIQAVRAKGGALVMSEQSILSGLYDALWATEGGKQAIAGFLDNKRVIKHLQEALEGGDPVDQLNAYNAARNLTSIVSWKLKEFEKDYAKPLMDAVAKAELSFEDVNSFIKWRAVFERNAQVKKNLVTRPAAKLDEQLAKVEAKRERLNAKIAWLRRVGKELVKGREVLELEDVESREEYERLAKSEMTLDDLVARRDATYQEAKAVKEKIAALDEKAADDNLPGAGITDAAAQKGLNALRDKGLVAFSGDAGADTVYGGKLGKVGDLFSKVVTRKEELMLEGGLVKKDVVLAMRKAFPRYYAPMKGMPPTPLEAAGYDEIVRGRGADEIATTGERRIVGRKVEAENPPLEQLFLDIGATIVRNEHNAARIPLYELAKAHPEAKTDTGLKLFEVDVDHTRRVTNKDTGVITETIDLRDDPHEVPVWIDGEKHTIRMNDGHLAAAVTNAGVPKTGAIVRNAGIVNRWFAQVNTSWNPAFTVPNFVRDFGTAMVRLSDADLKKYRAEVAKSWPKSASVIWRATRDGKLTAKEQAEWKDFRDNGGMVGHWLTPDIESQHRELAKLGAKAQRDPKSAMAYAVKVGEAIKGANTAAENCLRYSVYQAARKAGVSGPKAAMLARGITVDFNQVGNYSGAAGSFFLFFNASVQGSAVVLGAAAKSPVITRMVGGLVVGGFMHAVAMRALMGKDDDDDEFYWDKLANGSPHEIERNIILPMGAKGEKFKVPMPYGFNTAWAFGTQLANAAMGVTPPMQATGRTMTAALNGFNPLGEMNLTTANGWLSAVVPTVGDPLVDIVKNENYWGGPIRPEKMPWESGLPDSEMYFHSVSWPSKAGTAFLNRLTGGDEFTPGGIDTSPENIDHVLGAIVGGTGKTMGLGVHAVLSLLSGRPPKAATIPVVSRFYGEESAYYSPDVYYSNRQLLEETKTRLKQYRETYPKGGYDKALADEYRWLLSQEQRFKAWDKAVKRAKAAGDDAAAVKIQKQANKEVRLARERQEMGRHDRQ